MTGIYKDKDLLWIISFDHHSFIPLLNLHPPGILPLLLSTWEISYSHVFCPCRAVMYTTGPVADKCQATRIWCRKWYEL